MGHIARNCMEGGASYGGGSSYPSYGGGQGGGFGQQKQCYSCGGYGHMSRECLPAALGRECHSTNPTPR